MSKKYRVLHIIDSFGMGGAQEVTLNLLKHTDHNLFEPEVACLYGKGTYWEKYKRLGIPVHSLSPFKFIPLYIPALFFKCLGRKYDIVHTHLIASNLIAKPIAALTLIPLRFNHDHSNDYYRYKQKIRLWGDMLMNKLSSHIIAVSSSTRDFLLKWENIPENKITVVINGVDIERFYPQGEKRNHAIEKWGLPRNKIIIGGVGRLHFSKNYRLFLNIAANILLKRNDVHFAIAGNGPDENDLKRLASKLGISSHVSFLGYIRDMTEFYPVMDIFLLTSRYEGTPMTVLEAMACRIPVIAPALDGIIEVLKDGKSAMLCKEGNDKEFIEKLSLLINQPELSATLATKAYEDVQKNFSAGRMARDVEQIYLRHLNER